MKKSLMFSSLMLVIPLVSMSVSCNQKIENLGFNNDDEFIENSDKPIINDNLGNDSQLANDEEGSWSKLSMMFNELESKMKNPNFFDTLIKSDQKKSDYSTSSFVQKTVGFKYSLEEKYNQLSKLFNLPKSEQGLEFKILDVSYSNSINNKHLSPTQLKVKAGIYASSIGKSAEFEYIIDGFFNPYNQNSKYFKIKDNENWNRNNITKYSEVEEPYRDRVFVWGTWQTSWQEWGVQDFYLMYWFAVDGNESRKDQWVEYASNRVKKIIEKENKNVEKVYYAEVTKVKFVNKGKPRYGNYFSDGTLLTAISADIKIHPIGLDNKGNSIYKNYLPFEKKNLIFWLYFRDGLWK